MCGAVRGELAGERIVDLQENLHFGQSIMKIKPCSIDDDSDGALRNPRDRRGEELFIDTIEDVPAIPELVLDEAVLCNLTCRALVPSEDAGMRGEPTFLRAVDFMDSTPGVCSDCFSLAQIVRRMAKNLREFPFMLTGTAMVRVL